MLLSDTHQENFELDKIIQILHTVVSDISVPVPNYLDYFSTTFCDEFSLIPVSARLGVV